MASEQLLLFNSKASIRRGFFLLVCVIFSCSITIIIHITFWYYICITIIIFRHLNCFGIKWINPTCWITTDLFDWWLTDQFLKHAVGARLLLLLLDGHSTHYQPYVVQNAKEKGVMMLCLPPHTTHDAQPFDCAVFSPLTAQWHAVCHQFLQANPGKIITNFNFTALISRAWLLIHYNHT